MIIYLTDKNPPFTKEEAKEWEEKITKWYEENPTQNWHLLFEDDEIWGREYVDIFN